MNTNILFQQALLAEASYANFYNADGQLITDKDGVIAALIAEGFSQTQAADFKEHWKVISHQPDTASGFSARRLG